MRQFVKRGAAVKPQQQHDDLSADPKAANKAALAQTRTETEQSIADIEHDPEAKRNNDLER